MDAYLNFADALSEERNFTKLKVREAFEEYVEALKDYIRAGTEGR